MKQEISKLYWLWIPLIAAALQATLEIFLSGETASRLHSENGLHELLQILILFMGFCVCIKFFLKNQNKTVFLKFWFGLAAVCCFYVAFEELSWGQQILKWGTPEFWLSVNDQHETNLHNTTSWLDQKPRLILLLGIIFGGLIAPIMKYYNLLKLPSNLDEIMPSPKLMVIAILIIVSQLIEKFFELFDIVIFTRYSEVQELFMFYFVLLYLLILRSKTSQTEKS